MSGVAEKQFARNVEVLVALGLVRCIPRRGRSTAYVIDLAVLAAFEACRCNADPLATTAELLPASTAPLFRVLNACQPLSDRDVRYLAAEVEAAGLTLTSLVDLIDARGWLFARAD